MKNLLIICASFVLYTYFVLLVSLYIICNKNAEKSGKAVVEVQDDLQSSTKSQKAKTTKAERRALQEAQRAAKAAAKGSRIDFMYICYSMGDYRLLFSLFSHFVDIFPALNKFYLFIYLFSVWRNRFASIELFTYFPEGESD